MKRRLKRLWRLVRESLCVHWWKMDDKIVWSEETLRHYRVLVDTCRRCGKREVLGTAELPRWCS